MTAAGKRTRVVYIISHIDKAIGFEWIAGSINAEKFELIFILLNDKPSTLAKRLQSRGIEVHEMPVGPKWKWPFLYLRLARKLRKLRPDVIHSHMYVADMIGQLAGKTVGVKKRIYTRHSSNESRKYHRKSRIDRIVNSSCTHILAISENVKNILVKEENVDPSRIRLIHHGFDLPRFNVLKEDIDQLQRKYNPGNRRPVIGVVARYSHWKGIQHTIEAFTELLKDYPGALLILANAKKGDYKNEIAALLSRLPEGSYHEIEFEENLFALYQLFDVYVHVPVDEELEAFGQTYVEALAAGIPSVFTLSGVAREFIKHERNALVVDYQNPGEIKNAVARLLTDKALCKQLGEAGWLDVQQFSLDKMIHKLEDFYAE
jgi:glycosyltransferase involved in cell wall biosynthesis